MIEIPYSNKTNQIYDLLHSFIRDFIEELQKVYTIQGAKLRCRIAMSQIVSEVLRKTFAE